ncbi:unnamed protein product [Protopolystoma xenopodis]|uniref:Uncharacterized protein n=1 Tax=Protopolystoma xenopodis TaxID=117903 RepID=A0A448WGA6_9PLAT|nr:unnamed protein product [Protopolystoma xenopodis]
MAKLTDEADFDAGKTSGNVSRPWSDFGNDHEYNGLRTSLTLVCIPLVNRCANFCKFSVALSYLLLTSAPFLIRSANPTRAFYLDP